YRKTVFFFYQAHSNTGYRCFQGYTGIHQRQRGTTDRSHRAGTVRFGNLAHYTQGVREAVLGRQYCGNTTASQTTMTHFATASTAHTTTLTYRIGREVVVQHKAV